MTVLVAVVVFVEEVVMLEVIEKSRVVELCQWLC